MTTIKVRTLVFLFVFHLTLGTLRGKPAIELNKLSDCNGLVTVRTMLDHTVSDNCRRSRNSIEETLMSHFALMPHLQSCLLSASPIVGLSGFSCVDQGFPNQRELTCFRAVDVEAIKDYFARYDDVYLEKENAYLRAAADCSIGNKHAIQVGNSLFPISLNNVAKPRFGYALGIGTQHEADCWAYHGYADLDPTIDDKKLGGLEVFDMIRNQPPASSTVPGLNADARLWVKNLVGSNNDAAKAVDTRANPQPSLMRFKYGYTAIVEGASDPQFRFPEHFNNEKLQTSETPPDAEITVETKDMSGFDTDFADALEDKTHVSWLVKSAYIDFMYKGSKNVPTAKRQSDLDDWQRGVSSKLKEAGLRKLTSAELAQAPFHSTEDLRKAIIKASPFGQRELNDRTLGPNLILLINDEDDSCARAAYGFVREPEDQVKEDYGGMMIIEVGVGDGCQGVETPSNESVNKIIQYLRERTKAL